MVSIVGASGGRPFRASAARPYHARREKSKEEGRFANRPYRGAATIHPVRYFPKGFSSSKIGEFIPGSQGRIVI